MVQERYGADGGGADQVGEDAGPAPADPVDQRAAEEGGDDDGQRRAEGDHPGPGRRAGGLEDEPGDADQGEGVPGDGDGVGGEGEGERAAVAWGSEGVGGHRRAGRAAGGIARRRPRVTRAQPRRVRGVAGGSQGDGSGAGPAGRARTAWVWRRWWMSGCGVMTVPPWSPGGWGRCCGEAVQMDAVGGGVLGVGVLGLVGAEGLQQLTCAFPEFHGLGRGEAVAVVAQVVRLLPRGGPLVAGAEPGRQLLGVVVGDLVHQHVDGAALDGVGEVEAVRLQADAL